MKEWLDKDVLRGNRRVGSTGGRVRFLSAVGISTVVKIASVALLFTTSVVLARILGPAGLGAYTFAFTTISLAIMVAQLGIPELTVREVSQRLEQNRRGLLARFLLVANRQILLLSVGVAVLMAGLLVALGPERVPGWATLLIGLPLIILFPQSALAASIIRGTGHVVQSIFGQQLLRPSLFLLLIVLLINADIDASPLVVMSLHGIASLLVVIEMRRRAIRVLPPLGEPAKVAPQRFSFWRRSGLLFSGVAVAHLINTKFDTIALGVLSTEAEVGIYAVGVQLSQTAGAMLLITSGVVAPGIAAASVAGDEGQIERLCRQSAALSFLGACVAFLLVLFFGRWFIGWLFGVAYISVWHALLVLVGGHIVNAFFGPVGLLLNMRGQEGRTLQATIVAAAINIVLNFLFIPMWGILGAAVATIASLIYWNLVLCHRVWKIFRINTTILPIVGRWRMSPNKEN